MFRCAFYEKEITPPLGCHIPGYFNLRAGSDVKDRLYARASVIENGKETIAILSYDCCGVDKPLVKNITDRIEKYTGIPAANVLISATHTHTGIPRTSGYPADAEAMENQAGYHDLFVKLVADCVTLAHLRLQESALSFGKGEVDGISFCRNYHMKNSTPRTNPPRMSPDIVGPAGETDNELPVLFVKNSAGQPTGAVVCFACHPDCVGGTEYSGDYISELSIQLKKVYGPDFVTVFLQGTSGNINHFDVSKLEDEPDHYRKMGRIIAGEVIKTVANATELEDGNLISKQELFELKRTEISEEKIAEAQHAVDTIKEIPGVKIAADGTDPDQYLLAMSKKLLKFLKDTPETFLVPLQYIQIGDVKLYAFPGEIFSCFGKMVKEGAETDKCIVATMCGASVGYVPPRDMFYDTIYESRPGSNLLEREAGYKMAERLLAMGKE